MARRIKVEDKDVEKAILRGLAELGLRRDQAEVTVLEHPTRGFLGIGAKPAVVMLTKKLWGAANVDEQIYMDVPKKKNNDRGGRRKKDKEEDAPAPRAERAERAPRAERSERPERNGRGDKRRGGKKFEKGARGGRKGGRKFETDAPLEPLTPQVSKEHEPQLAPAEHILNAVIPDNMKAPMEEAKNLLSKTLDFMGVKYSNLNVWWDDKQGRVLLTFDTESPAIVIGKDGKTLEALQYLITLALSRQFDTNISVMADTQNYWRKTEDKLEREIAKAIDAVKRGMSIFRMRPMPSQMRRYIHRALASHDIAQTASEGEGKWRKVVVKAKDLALKTAELGAVTAANVAADAAEKVVETISTAADTVLEAGQKAQEFIETATDNQQNNDQPPQ